MEWKKIVSMNKLSKTWSAWSSTFWKFCIIRQLRREMKWKKSVEISYLGLDMQSGEKLTQDLWSILAFCAFRLSFLFSEILGYRYFQTWVGKAAISAGPKFFILRWGIMKMMTRPKRRYSSLARLKPSRTIFSILCLVHFRIWLRIGISAAGRSLDQ